VSEADEKGIWQRLWSKMIGVDVNAINITENREQFKMLKKKWVPSALQKYVLLTLEKRTGNLVSH
jgi:carbamoyl-phosphate synthase large subunit